MELKKVIGSIVLMLTVITTVNAAPLPSGTGLTLTPGVGSDINVPCPSGSCIGSEMVPGTILWADLAPGTDGGFIVGKSQASGGQELVQEFDNLNPGELTAASRIGFGFAAGDATVFTPSGDVSNVFDDSCSGTGCSGLTDLGSLNVAVNGNSIPVGGGIVSNYQIDLVANTWSMEYLQAVTSGPFMGQKFFFVFRGSVVPINCPVVDFGWQHPDRQLLFVFGSNLTGVTSVKVDGIDAFGYQEIGETFLAVVPPPGVTLPWKPGTIDVTTSVGCSSHFPKPCAQ